MSGLFFDTNILLYAARTKLEARDSFKRPIAQQLLIENDFMVSGQVLAEFYHNATKIGPYQITSEEADMWLEQLSVQHCVAVNAQIVKSGAALAKRYQISYWDGAILAAAQEGGADILYTEDLNNGQAYGRVMAINPFQPIAQ
jgi:predicted nucleic acid-binding protein